MYRFEKNLNGEQDLVINGFENGVFPSPLKGIANLQNVNISTETGEAMCSFQRIQQSQTLVSTLTLTRVNSTTISFSGPVLSGTWITIISDSGTGLSGSYYVISISGVFHLSTTYIQDNSTIVSGINAGTATFSTISFGLPISSATEAYYDSSNNQQYRYYIVDSTGHVWVHDTNTLTTIDTPLWFLPDKATYSINPPSVKVTGLAVFNGWLVLFRNATIFWKSTSTLGVFFAAVEGNNYPGTTMTSKFHNPFVGHQGTMYYCDGNFIGSVFPDTSLLTGAANIQSYCSYTAVTTTGTISANIGGSLPTTADGTIRIPVFFLTTGTLPSTITTKTIYWILMSLTDLTFQVYSASAGGSALNIQTGAVGAQFFNTFNPIADTSSFGSSVMTVTPQRFNLPFSETAQCMAEIGNNVIIGGSGNVLYPWDQVSNLPFDLIFLPENNTVKIIVVNNSGYIFTGQKGNIYITNGSSASPVISVPDYCAGIAGTPNSYIEPYFSWGDAMYLRGRVYFSILDQTVTKAGNCGGIWSFVPTQNIFIQQDTGLSLRLENQSSYGTYSGVCPVILVSQNQTAIAPQYWSAWYSNITNPTYGIDFTGTTPNGISIIETDLMRTGTMLQNQTFSQIEYKLSTQLANGETIVINYRLNSTDAWTSCGTVKTVSATELSGYYTANFENSQWLQLQIILTPINSSSSSFCRLAEIRIR